MKSCDVGSQGGQGTPHPQNIQPRRRGNTSAFRAAAQAQLQNQRQQTDGGQDNDRQRAAEAATIGIENHQRKDANQRAGYQHRPTAGIFKVGQKRSKGWTPPSRTPTSGKRRRSLLVDIVAESRQVPLAARFVRSMLKWHAPPSPPEPAAQIAVDAHRHGVLRRAQAPRGSTRPACRRCETDIF